VSRVAANIGAGIGGGIGGLVAAYGLPDSSGCSWPTASPILVRSVLIALVPDGGAAAPLPGGYGWSHVTELRPPAIVNVAIIAVGWGGLHWLVPLYAKNALGISAPLIGLLAAGQRGHGRHRPGGDRPAGGGPRRVVTVGLAAAMFVGACLLVIGRWRRWAFRYPALLTATILGRRRRMPS